MDHIYYYQMPYILEVQKFNPEGRTTYPEWHGKREHIVYMNKIFKTEQEDLYTHTMLGVAIGTLILI